MHRRLVPTFGKRLHLSHASCHIYFAKLVHLYHLKMPTLQDGLDMGKDEFHSYTEEGFFTIRCNDRFWAGVWSDMTKEHGY